MPLRLKMAGSMATQQRQPSTGGGIRSRCKKLVRNWRRLLCFSSTSISPERRHQHRKSTFPITPPSSRDSASISDSRSNTYKKPSIKIQSHITTNMIPHNEDSDEMIVRGENNFDIPYVDLLTWLFGNDKYDHEKTIFVDALNPERAFTANQAKSIIKSLIGGLRSIGVKPGDAVCIHSFNDIYYPLVFLAIVGVGGRFVGTNPGHTVLELNNHLAISETKFLIVQPDLFPNILKVAGQLGIPDENIIAFDTDGQFLGEYKFRSYRELLQHKEEDWVCFNDEVTAKQTIMGMFSSSGTTGMPKVIALSHYAWVAGSVILPEVLERPYEVRRLMCLPTFHGFAAPLTVGVPIRMGQTTYIMPRFDLKQFCKAVEDHLITDTAVVPPCLQVFVKYPLERPNQLKSLKRVWCGAAPLSIKLQNEVIKLFADDAEIVNIWGMTEIGITVGLKYDEADRTGSASKLLANTESKIIDESGVNITGTDKEGEVCIRTPQTALGYYRNEQATEETFQSDGWVRTGDIGYFNDQKLYLVDRKKELIKVRGWQVAPAELEGILFSHPKIQDAAVVGVKIPSSNQEEMEAPRAYIVRQPGDKITEDEVKEFVLSKLSKYKALDGGVFFVEAIPKSAAGKILKKIIRSDEWIKANVRVNDLNPQHH